MEKISTCQIAFIPIASNDYRSDVKKVLDVITDSGLEVHIGVMSTLIRGEKNKILKLIETIYEIMDPFTRFVIDIKISNVCGCEKEN
jgi:uncharacterized protein YqgV (UPF0045/DUF77 family)